MNRVLFLYPVVYFSFFRPGDLTLYADLPPDLRQINVYLLPGWALGSLQLVWVCASVLIKNRFAMVVATFCFAYIVMLVNAWGHPRIGHTYLLFAMVVMCLSSDNKSAGEVIFYSGILHFWGAGLEKLFVSGWAWVTGDTLRHHLTWGGLRFDYSHLQYVVNTFFLKYVDLKFLSGAVMAAELLCPLAFMHHVLRYFFIIILSIFIVAVWLAMGPTMFEFLVLLGFGLQGNR